MILAGVNIAGVKCRRSYHHGDLRSALIAAGAELAEDGGPDAITIRAASAKAGVTPTAAYRHFADHAELLAAVRDEAVRRLAAAMRANLPDCDNPSDATAAVELLIATGRGYIDFARSQPGLFRTAFTANAKRGAVPDPKSPGPFGMLNTALDLLVDTGGVAADERQWADFAAWSAVHGMALLLIDGPLSGVSASDQEGAIQRTFSMVLRGLAPAAD